MFLIFSGKTALPEDQPTDRVSKGIMDRQTQP